LRLPLLSGFKTLIPFDTPQDASSFGTMFIPRPVALSGFVIKPINSCSLLLESKEISGFETYEDEAITTFNLLKT